jgi:Mrp family chromosome partitioning ATPase
LNITTNASANANANADRLATIWAIVEARQTFPALILVASATAIDDTQPVARGLGLASQDAGKRTGFLYLGAGIRRKALGEPLGYDELSISGRQSQRENFDALLGGWRRNYDVIIIEIPQLASCGLGAHVARLSDGIVVALFPDRQVTKADRELTTLFSQLGASVIGVVKTAVPAGNSDLNQAKNRSFGSLFFPVRQQ